MSESGEGRRWWAVPADQRPRRQPDIDHVGEVDPAAGWPIAEDFDSDRFDVGREVEEDRDRRVAQYTRQICVRLSWDQHAELSRAADLYGVAPGTMGRILVRRGARAILDARRRYDLYDGGD